MRTPEAEKALALFCEDQYPRLVGMLSLYCRDRSVAEELAQEALIRACRDWRKVQAMDHPERWLVKVATNLAKSNFRRIRAEARAKERLAGQASVKAQPDGEDSRIVVRQAISALPHRQKLVLILHYYCGLSMVEIAESLQLPEGTVRSTASRATKRLHRQFELVDA